MKTIRIAVPGDAVAVADIYAPAVADSAISFETEVPSAAEMAARIERASAFAPWLVLVDGGRIDGFAYAGRHRERAAYRWCVDTTIYVRAGRQRAGVGRALYTSLFALLRLQGFRAAHAGITLPNPASVGLHTSFGFEPVGVYRRVGFKDGRWHDVGWWQLALGAREGVPVEPLGVDELRNAPEFASALAAGIAPR